MRFSACPTSKGNERCFVSERFFTNFQAVTELSICAKTFQKCKIHLFLLQTKTAQMKRNKLLQFGVSKFRQLLLC